MLLEFLLLLLKICLCYKTLLLFLNLLPMLLNFYLCSQKNTRAVLKKLVLLESNLFFIKLLFNKNLRILFSLLFSKKIIKTFSLILDFCKNSKILPCNSDIIGFTSNFIHTKRVILHIAKGFNFWLYFFLLIFTKLFKVLYAL